MEIREVIEILQDHATKSENGEKTETKILLHVDEWNASGFNVELDINDISLLTADTEKVHIEFELKRQDWEKVGRLGNKLDALQWHRERYTELPLEVAQTHPKFEYKFITYIQELGGLGYRFYEHFNDTGVTVQKSDDILPVLNHYGKDGWAFINWDRGRMIFKREVLMNTSTPKEEF